MQRLTFQERFEKQIGRKEPDQCWVWLGSKDGAGYGKFFKDGKRLCAHRIAWELANSLIPQGLMVLHRCDNRPCVNPAHLFLGTAKDNTQDMISKGRARLGGSGHGASNTCRFGHPIDSSNGRHKRCCGTCRRIRTRSTQMDAKLAAALEQLWKQAQEQHAAELARIEWERS